MSRGTSLNPGPQLSRESSVVDEDTTLSSINDVVGEGTTSSISDVVDEDDRDVGEVHEDTGDVEDAEDDLECQFK